jgi:hypothetical protein
VTRRRTLPVVLAALLVLGACGDPPERRGVGRSLPGAAVSVPTSLRTFRSTARLAAVPEPVRLKVPSAGVDSSLERLGQSGGVIQVPRRWQRAGWYRDGPRPGEPGAAVILGHVDSPSGPAVFAGLAGLARGAAVRVARSDGSVVTFRVTRVELRARSRFPADEVYWPTLRPELRLITCGGRYDRSRGGYLSNVIVFAVQQGPI